MVLVIAQDISAAIASTIVKCRTNMWGGGTGAWRRMGQWRPGGMGPDGRAMWPGMGGPRSLLREDLSDLKERPFLADLFSFYKAHHSLHLIHSPRI